MNKKWVLFILFIFSFAVYANGVAVVDPITGKYFRLSYSKVDVDVNNQVAVVKSYQIFRNNFEAQQKVEYMFPAIEGASATNLRWYAEGEWFEAYIAPGGGGSSSGGSGQEVDENLTEYLGENPVTFNIPQWIQPDSVVIIELTYVQLLDYHYGKVYFNYPNDYTLIQTDILDSLRVDFKLFSVRPVENVVSASHPEATVTTTANSGRIVNLEVNKVADTDYAFNYKLGATDIGLYSMSTFLSDSASVADTIGGGYFLFIVEPDQSSSSIIEKVFTLIIDRSGSMSGNKMVQARDAAKYIVNNLNDGDKFNVVSFSGNISQLSEEHLPVNDQTINLALDYINSLNALGSTNISGSFDTAVPQFFNTSDSTANLIIFFTDGQPTSGIVDPEGLVQHVNSLIVQHESEISVNCFGIGDDVNKQLLNLIASQNNGHADFLLDNELEEKITEFYNVIRNPVILSPEMTSTPQVVFDVFPSPLPNLYQGHQMLIAGRYNEGSDIEFKFTGYALGQDVEYTYNATLTNDQDAEMQFLPKVWAKQKIRHLLIQYYNLDPLSQQAKDLKAQIVWLSIKYGVLTEFTIFTTNVPVELISFAAVLNGNRVELSWTTSTELNNQGFEVQRRFGENDWTTIGYVEGKGTTTEIQEYSYSDDLTKVNYKGKIYYRLKQIDYDGTFEYSKTIEINWSAADKFILEQNYPNPFNPSTTIGFVIPVESNVQIAVYNVTGEKVSEWNQELTRGYHEYKWNAGDLSSGIYFYQIVAKSKHGTEVYNTLKKMIMMK